MDSKLWQRVEELFHQALEMPADQRNDFVIDAAQHDSQLRMEVLTLLKSHDSDSNFLENRSPITLADSLAEMVAAFPSNEITQENSTAEPSPIGHSTERSFPLSEFDSEREMPAIAELMACRPDFQVRSLINRGGMGVVFRVFQQSLNREIAVKILRTSKIDEPKRERFLQESKATAQISNDHVVKIYEVGDNTPIPFLAMELITGPSLKRFIKQQRLVEPRLAAELTRQIAVGLSSAHQANLVHRDVKPANVLLEPINNKHRRISGSNDTVAWRAKLIDFGLARSLESDFHQRPDFSLAGTLSFMSPEQLLAPNTVDHRSDIYSLGVTLYQMLTGELPFRGAPHVLIRKIENFTFPLPRQLDDRIPRDIESICLKAMSNDRDRRYQTATELADDLNRFLDGQATLARPISRGELITRWIAHNQKIAGFAAVTASLLMMLAIGSLIFAVTVNRKNQEIVGHQQQREKNQVQRILDAEPSALPSIISELTSPDFDLAADQLIAKLQQQFEHSPKQFNRKFNAAVALSNLGVNQADFVIASLEQLHLSPANCRNVVSAVGRDRHAIKKLTNRLDNSENIRLQAQIVIVLAELGEDEPWLSALAEVHDPSLAAEIVHIWRDWHSDPKLLFSMTTHDESVTGNLDNLRRAIAQSLKLTDRRSLSQPTIDAAKAWLASTAEKTSSYSVFASAEQALFTWGDPIPHRTPTTKSDWEQLTNGIRMVPIQPATTRMGRLEAIKIYQGYPPHEVAITRPFAIADTEITVEQFLEFVNDPNCTAQDKPSADWMHSETISPTNHHPVQNVSWNDAVKFCNWLSRRENLQPVYKLKPQPITLKTTDNQMVTIEDWRGDLTANGYRLPLEHEFELACRDGSTTKHYFGSNSDFFGEYGLTSNHTLVAAGPVRNLLANRLGLFDTEGNVWEWCHDWHSFIEKESLTDPTGPEQPDTSPAEFGRVIRGGGVATRSGETDAESRGHWPPHLVTDNLGFRVAKFLNPLPAEQTRAPGKPGTETN